MVLDNNDASFWIFDDVDDIDPQMWGDEFVANIHEALGEKRPIELDI